MKWPLNDSFFTWKDRLKICSFFLNSKNRWTQGNKVQELEHQMSKYAGGSKTVFVSSGSAANTLLALYAAEKIKTSEKNIVILPAVTWQTSCSPWIHFGFQPKFIDISLEDFGMNLNLLENYLKDNSNKVAIIFITSLLGFSPSMSKLAYLGQKYKVKIYLDNCESTFSSINSDGDNINSVFTSTTSSYFGHLFSSVEGGFLFTNSEEEYQYFLLNRSHGMARNLLNSTFTVHGYNLARNHTVDKEFDFVSLGNNFRNTDIHAMLGLLDFARKEEYIQRRRELYSYFYSLRHHEYHLPELKYNVPFCLPIIPRYPELKPTLTLKKECENMGIETRPVISGNLLRQTCYKKYGNYTDFPIADYIHKNGFYIGLHKGITNKMIHKLLEKI